MGKHEAHRATSLAFKTLERVEKIARRTEDTDTMLNVAAAYMTIMESNRQHKTDAPAIGFIEMGSLDDE